MRAEYCMRAAACRGPGRQSARRSSGGRWGWGSWAGRGAGRWAETQAPDLHSGPCLDVHLGLLRLSQSSPCLPSGGQVLKGGFNGWRKSEREVETDED